MGFEAVNSWRRQTSSPSWGRREDGRLGLALGLSYAAAIGAVVGFLTPNPLLTSASVLVLLLLIPGLELLFRYVVAERIGTIILSTIVAHTAWHWMIDRAEKLQQFRFDWPTLTATAMLVAVRWMTIGLVVGFVVWLLAIRRSRSAISTQNPEIE